VCTICDGTPCRLVFPRNILRPFSESKSNQNKYALRSTILFACFFLVPYLIFTSFLLTVSLLAMDFNSEDGVSTFLRNMYKFLPDVTFEKIVLFLVRFVLCIIELGLSATQSETLNCGWVWEENILYIWAFVFTAWRIKRRPLYCRKELLVVYRPLYYSQYSFLPARTGCFEVSLPLHTLLFGIAQSV
jgi:hypothetical protein